MIEVGSVWRRKTDEFTKIVEVTGIRSSFKESFKYMDYPVNFDPWITVKVIEGVCLGKEFVYHQSEFYELYDEWVKPKPSTKQGWLGLCSILDRIELINQNREILYIEKGDGGIEAGIQSFQDGVITIEYVANTSGLDEAIIEIHKYLQWRSS